MVLSTEAPHYRLILSSSHQERAQSFGLEQFCTRPKNGTKRAWGVDNCQYSSTNQVHMLRVAQVLPSDLACGICNPIRRKVAFKHLVLPSIFLMVWGLKSRAVVLASGSLIKRLSHDSGSRVLYWQGWNTKTFDCRRASIKKKLNLGQLEHGLEFNAVV